MVAYIPIFLVTWSKFLNSNPDLARIQESKGSWEHRVQALLGIPGARSIVPFKCIEYGPYVDLNIQEAMFYLRKGDYRTR